MRWMLWCAALAGLAMLGGCGVNYGAGGQSAAAVIPPRQGWSALGHLVSSPNLAIDGDLSTSAVSAKRYNGAELIIDLGKSGVFNMIVLDHGANEMGGAARLAVYTSSDGRRFKPQMSIPGGRKVTVINLVTPTLARFIKIQVTVPSDCPWSIAEVWLQ